MSTNLKTSPFCNGKVAKHLKVIKSNIRINNANRSKALKYVFELVLSQINKKCKLAK